MENENNENNVRNKEGGIKYKLGESSGKYKINVMKAGIISGRVNGNDQKKKSNEMAWKRNLMKWNQHRGVMKCERNEKAVMKENNKYERKYQ